MSKDLRPRRPAQNHFLNEVKDASALYGLKPTAELNRAGKGANPVPRLRSPVPQHDKRTVGGNKPVPRLRSAVPQHDSSLAWVQKYGSVPHANFCPTRDLLSF